MLTSLRRIYLYLVAAVALIATTFVVQNFFHALLQHAGMLDYSYQTYNLINLRQATAFLVVAFVIFVPLGGLHVWFIRREDSSALGGVVRGVFLDLLTIITGIVTITALSITGNNLFSNQQYPVGAGPYLAAALAWGIALALIIIERQRTVQQLPAARGISLALGYLTQFGLLIALVSYTAYAIQTVLETVLSVAPDCNFSQNAFFTACQNPPNSSVGSVVAVLIVLVGGMAGFMVWTRHDTDSIYRQIAHGAFLIVGSIAAMIGIDSLAQLFLNLVTSQPNVSFPLAIVSNNQRSFLVLGPLVAGGVTVAYLLVRVFRTANTTHHTKQGRQIATIMLSFPLAAVFLSGMALVVDRTLQLARGEIVGVSDWFTSESLIIAGLAWVALWPMLARMSDPRGEGPTAPRRFYVLAMLGASLIGTAISLAVALYDTFSSLIGSPIDTTGDNATTGFAIALVLGATAGYYIVVLLRDQRILKHHAPTISVADISAVAEPGQQTEVAESLETILQRVAAQELPVATAAHLLRERFGAR